MNAITNAITLDQLRASIATLLDDEADQLTDDANLLDLGLDSMRAMNLAMQWDEAGVPLDLGDLAEAPTVAELWALLSARRKGAAS